VGEAGNVYGEVINIRMDRDTKIRIIAGKLNKLPAQRAKLIEQLTKNPDTLRIMLQKRIRRVNMLK
jgi:hypothetical protein